MTGVTSLSVLFMLLALCPLDVARFPEDIQVMYFKDDPRTCKVINLATKKMTDLFSAPGTVSAMDYDPVTKKVYWCQTDRKCYAQDYGGSNPTLLFTTTVDVKEMRMDGNSTFYYIDFRENMWVKRDGQEAVLFTNYVQSLTIDRLNGRMIFVSDNNGWIRDFAGKLSIHLNDAVTSISWNPSDGLLYASVYVYDGLLNVEIRSIDLNTGKQIAIRRHHYIGSNVLNAYRDIIVFDNVAYDYSLNAMYTNGTNVTYFGPMSSNPPVKPILLDAINPPGCIQGV